MLERLRRPIRDLRHDMTEVRARLDKQRARLDRAAKVDAQLRGQLLKLQDRLSRQQELIKELRRELGPVQHDQRQREVDYVRAMQQLGALETRVGRLEERLEPDRFTADDESLREARSLVDTVRREHDQVRVRFQIISAYEERMRRLEAAVIDMYDGDVRHPI